MAHPKENITERNTTTTTTDTRSGTGIAFILGAVVVVLAVVVYFVFVADGTPPGSGADDVNITIEGAQDPAPAAVDGVEGTTLDTAPAAD